jgi:hypothetical protein
VFCVLPRALRGGSVQLPFQPMPQGGSSLTTSFPCFKRLSRLCSLSRESLNMSISVRLCSTACLVPVVTCSKNPGPASCRAGTNLLNEYAGNTRVWKSLQSLFNTANRSATVGEKREPRSARNAARARNAPTAPNTASKISGAGQVWQSARGSARDFFCPGISRAGGAGRPSSASPGASADRVCAL